MLTKLNKEKIKKISGIIFFSIILFVVVSGLLFYIGILGIGALQQYNERRLEHDGTWLGAVGGRGCNYFAHISDEEFKKELSNDLKNISNREKKRIERTIMEMQEEADYSEDCKNSQKRFLKYLIDN